MFLVWWWQWALGASLADMYIRGKRSRWTRFLRVKFAPALFLIASLVVGLKDPTIWGLHIRLWVLPLLCAGLLGSLVIRPGGHVPFLSKAGVYSYSIYLIHPLAMAALLALHGYKQLPTAIGVPVTIFIATLVSWLFFLLVERHFLSVRRRRTEPLLALAYTHWVSDPDISRAN